MNLETNMLKCIMFYIVTNYFCQAAERKNQWQTTESSLKGVYSRAQIPKHSPRSNCQQTGKIGNEQ